jgi:uncharacterized protein YegP (UPF0339 family)
MERTTRSTRYVLGALALVCLAIVLSLLVWNPSALALQNDGDEAGAGRKAAPAAKFEVYKDRAGEFRWRLRALNRKVLAGSGEGYAAKADCLAAIESVKRAAASAPVEELKEEPPK